MGGVKLNELAVLAKGGDEEALQRFDEERRVMVRGMANVYFMVGADRDDVIQEGMIGLLGAIRTFDPAAGASFKTFSELCVKRHIINAVKMAGRKKHMMLNESVSYDVSPESTNESAGHTGASLEETLRAPQTTDPEQIVILADLVAYVESNSRELFSDMERAVWHEYSRGNSAARIAEQFGKKPKAVINALSRIKDKIEKLISTY